MTRPQHLQLSNMTDRQRVRSSAALPCLLLSLLLQATTTTATHYPRPVDETSRALAASQWEPVDEFRQRLQIPFSYQPQALHPEDCRYLTEEECYQSDMLKLHYMEQQQQRALQYTSFRTPDDEGHALVLLMRFTDHETRDLPTRQQHQKLWQHDIHDWLKSQSFGKHAPTFDVLEWMDTDNTEEFYSAGDYGRSEGFVKSVHYLLEQLDADRFFDWSRYDKDGDGQVDNLIVLHSGYNAETFQLDCYSDRAPEMGIWSHWKFDPKGWTSSKSGHKVNRYMVTSASDGACGNTPATMGILTMNYMHSLGLDSLYDQGNGIGNGIGKYDMMAYPYGNSNDGEPGALSSYSKAKVQWVEPMEVTENTYVQLGPWGNNPDSIRIQKPYAFREYLLLENRQPVGDDEGFFGSGIAIYHIDETQNGQIAPSYPGKPDYPKDHYMVAIIPRDGNYDLEKGTNKGDAGDLWQVGDSLGPGQGGTVFPNTDGYYGGNINENGLSITIVDQCGVGQQGRNIVILIQGLSDNDPGEAPACKEGPPVTTGGGGSVSRPEGRKTDAPTAAPMEEEGPEEEETGSNGRGPSGASINRPFGSAEMVEENEEATEGPNEGGDEQGQDADKEGEDFGEVSEVTRNNFRLGNIPTATPTAAPTVSPTVAPTAATPGPTGVVVESPADEVVESPAEGAVESHTSAPSAKATDADIVPGTMTYKVTTAPLSHTPDAPPAGQEYDGTISAPAAENYDLNAGGGAPSLIVPSQQQHSAAATMLRPPSADGDVDTDEAGVDSDETEALNEASHVFVQQQGSPKSAAVAGLTVSSTWAVVGSTCVWVLVSLYAL